MRDMRYCTIRYCTVLHDRMDSHCDSEHARAIIGVLGSGRNSGKRSDRRRDLPDNQQVKHFNPTMTMQANPITGFNRRVRDINSCPVGQRPGLPGLQTHHTPGETPRTTVGSRDARSSNAKGNRDARCPAKGSARESQMVGIEHEVGKAR
jgi:hypothetical protein